MTTTVHFIDVGQGNMALVQCADGTNFVVDCNITEDNKSRIINYLASNIGRSSRIRAFICTHRDADHMRGVDILHDNFPLQGVWDSGYPGTTTDSSEYDTYMRLRRLVGSTIIQKGTHQDFGSTRFRYLSAADRRLPDNANEQGIVVKVEQRAAYSAAAVGSTIITGDGGATKWKRGIMQDHYAEALSCDILLAAHHGSITFFDDPDNSWSYYTTHMKAMTPAMVVVSVGKNQYGHPDEKALELYREYSTGSNNGHKVFRTDRQGTMKLTLKSVGGWILSPYQ